MALNWIDPRDFSFDCLLLMERFQLRWLLRPQTPDLERALGAALRAHPAVAWYAARRCPERAARIAALTAAAPDGLTAAEVRACEVAVLGAAEDFVIYTRPELMATHCPFIAGWDKARLFELADVAGRTVLDVGSGSGRLAFAAAERAREVYACEPVGTLREYLRERAAREGVRNLRVADGMADSLPWPDGTFDIVMSGHVVGDDYDAELAELTRVVRGGGWLLDCPGEEDRPLAPRAELRRRGFEELHYVSVYGGDVYRYRKQIFR